MNKNNENDLFLTEVEGVKEFHLDVNKAITEKKLVRTSGESQLSILSNFQHVPPELACVSSWIPAVERVINLIESKKTIRFYVFVCRYNWVSWVF